MTLAGHVTGGGGANRMAGEFSVKNEEGALEFVASEMRTDGKLSVYTVPWWFGWLLW